MTTPVAILIFDGDCGFCTSAANYIVARTRVPIQAVPWQFTDVTQYGLLQPQAADRVWLINSAGEKYGGHEAFAQLLLLQNKAWLKPFAYGMLIPPFCFLASMGYRLVARYRHKLPGGTPACKLPR